MALSSDLAAQFAKATKNNDNSNGEATVYGTIVVDDNSTYVKLDGSDLLTPVYTTAEVKTGERVVVMVKNHSATVMGNITSPSISIATVDSEVDTLKDEITTNLRIESSRGTVFKNDNIATVLSAVIYRGSNRITDIDTLHSLMGAGAYLQWSWQRLDEDSYGLISSSDYRLGNGGFTFTLSPDDVDTKVTFMCELIV